MTFGAIAEGPVPSPSQLLDRWRASARDPAHLPGSAMGRLGQLVESSESRLRLSEAIESS